MPFSSENYGEYRFACIEGQSSVPCPGAFHRRRGAYSIGAPTIARLRRQSEPIAVDAPGFQPLRPNSRLELELQEMANAVFVKRLSGATTIISMCRNFRTSRRARLCNG